MTDHAQDTRVRDALELLNSYARDKKTEFQEMLSGRYSNLKTAVGDFGDRMGDEASELYAKGRDKAKQVAKDVDESVHKHPWTYIGGAALGALIVGYLLGRSRR